MSFRTRLLTTFLVTVLLPAILLLFVIRHEMTKRFSEQYTVRVESLIRIIDEDLHQQAVRVGDAQAVIHQAMREDNRLRSAVVGSGVEDRSYVLDYARRAMRLSGLSMLQLQDRSGRILSSGHFRNEFDRLEPELPRLLASTGDGTALVKARAPDAPFTALATVDSLQLAGKTLYVVAGVRVERDFLDRLGREDDLKTYLIEPSDQAMPAREPGQIVEDFGVAYIGLERERVERAVFRVSHSTDSLQSLKRSVDRWFLLAAVITILIAVVVVGWIARRIARPLVALAEKTSRVDLDQLDVDFDTHRTDEIGRLARMLSTMTQRLRGSRQRIQDAERRATLGEMARQVNHDIKNGLTPIRNVFRHLSELVKGDPGELQTVLKERQETIDGGIQYLEQLAANYAKLTPSVQRGACDVSRIAGTAVAALGADAARLVETQFQENCMVVADPLHLRRIVENLLRNSVDSLQSERDRVNVSTARNGSEVHLTIRDTGAGMNEEQKARLFEDFYTTRSDGTGLGMSIVRRLVSDLGGRIRVDSEVGRGTTVLVTFPTSATA